MRKLGELRVVANEHHALQLVIEFTNDRKQGLGLGGIQPFIHDDILGLITEFLGDELRRRKRSTRGTRQDQVGFRLLLRQALPHHGSVTLAAISQRPLRVGQVNAIPTRLGVTDKD
jgi:hypothetical protein